jgi:hypothetical protein
MLIRESSDWPPRFGGAHEPGRELPEPEEGILSGIYPENDDLVTFTCRFEGRDSNRHLKAHSAELAEKITEVLRQNVGKAVTELAELKIPTTASAANS